MRAVRAGLELRVVMHADEEALRAELHGFDELPVRREAAERQARGGQAPAGRSLWRGTVVVTEEEEALLL